MPLYQVLKKMKICITLRCIPPNYEEKLSKEEDQIDLHTKQSSTSYHTMRNLVKFPRPSLFRSEAQIHQNDISDLCVCVCVPLSDLEIVQGVDFCVLTRRLKVEKGVLQTVQRGAS